MNPLLSRKRALVTVDKKPRSAKKRKSNVEELSLAKDKIKGHISGPLKPTSTSGNSVQSMEEELQNPTEDKTVCMTTLTEETSNGVNVQEAVKPERRPFQVAARASTPEQDDLVEGKEDSDILGKDLACGNRSPTSEIVKAKNRMAIDIDKNKVHNPDEEERISTFSHFSVGRRTATPQQRVKSCRQAGRRSLGPRVTDKEKEYRRKTMCLTPAQCSVPWNQNSAVKKNVLRSAPPKSLPSKKPQVTAEQNGLSKSRLFNSRTMNLAPNSVLRQKPTRGRSVAFGEEIQSWKRSNARMSVDSSSKSNTTNGTPFRSRIASLPPTSVLKSAPTRPNMSSQRKTQPCRKSVGTESSKMPQSSLTPFSSRIANLPPTSILKSAPSRRSVATITALKDHQATLSNEVTPKEPASNRKRRNTIHFARDSDANVAAAVAPFTPRGEWQNKDLSVRYQISNCFCDKAEVKPVFQYIPIDLLCSILLNFRNVGFLWLCLLSFRCKMLVANGRDEVNSTTKFRAISSFKQ